jgi:hypothetical protein
MFSAYSPASRCHSTLVALTELSSLVSAATLLLRSCPTALLFSADWVSEVFAVASWFARSALDSSQQGH